MTEVAYRRTKQDPLHHHSLLPVSQSTPIPISRTEVFTVQSNNIITKRTNHHNGEEKVNGNSVLLEGGTAGNGVNEEKMVQEVEATSDVTNNHHHTPTQSLIDSPTQMRHSPTHPPTQTRHSPTQTKHPPTQMRHPPTHSPTQTRHSPTYPPTQTRHSPTHSLNLSSDLSLSPSPSPLPLNSPPLVAPLPLSTDPPQLIREGRSGSTGDYNVTGDTLFGDSSFSEEGK